MTSISFIFYCYHQYTWIRK